MSSCQNPSFSLPQCGGALILPIKQSTSRLTLTPEATESTLLHFGTFPALYAC